MASPAGRYYNIFKSEPAFSGEDCCVRPVSFSVSGHVFSQRGGVLYANCGLGVFNAGRAGAACSRTISVHLQSHTLAPLWIDSAGIRVANLRAIELMAFVTL
ncbi:hypothetical protein EVAR_18337_1 [Eumeta japonica]|uniref:Uncharacterized protein n=1 Tax=Eumeta variegata TaxID=151549 RepID=A0A4C1V9X5_EUMVA|nr:hypothetical protein EVAR_18337_1 [Eumeta japonica]